MSYSLSLKVPSHTWSLLDWLRGMPTTVPTVTTTCPSCLSGPHLRRKEGPDTQRVSFGHAAPVGRKEGDVGSLGLRGPAGSRPCHQRVQLQDGSRRLVSWEVSF